MVRLADAGATPPADATTELSGFSAWGYISEDGVSENHDVSSDSTKAYGGATVLVIEGGDEVTYEFTPLEYTNPVVQRELFGTDNVTDNSGALASVKVTDDSHQARVFVFEHVLSNGVIERDVCPNAKVTAIDSNTYSSTAALGPKVTVTVFPDESGVKVYKYFAASAKKNGKE